MKLSLFISYTFKVTFVVFADVFEELYIFSIIMDPFHTSFLAPYILNTPCETEDSKSWKWQNVLKFVGFTVQSYQKLIEKLVEKLSKSKDIYAYDLLWENVIFWGCAAWSYHCIQKRW